MAEDPFAELERNALEFQRQIEQIPEEIIIGLVGQSGAGGVKGVSDAWYLVVHLEAWKNAAGEVNREKLRVEFPVSEEVLSDYMNGIKGYSVLKIKARLGQHPGGYLQGLASELISIVEMDSELSQIAEELQEPVILIDPQFGNLTLDRTVDWYRATVKWGGVEVDLDLSCDDADDVQKTLDVARKLWEQEIEWSVRVKDFAVKELLESKNGLWLEEDEAEVTPDEFKNRMVIETITIYSDGNFEFWHNDGDLFWGHAIQISGNLAEGLTDADTPG
ncbi:DUF2262 domain-containing protein [uncultured Gimesia sp.]|uniref:DUF2262 domain-containing protein n=1 Tax=uncultured Gimesia sp. TaxID=1678688 RepID=UPI0030D916D1|tara:strand:- start:181444 stop:182271 length:828 start_codon:yes stop_codon:yes gene_type:complete